MPITVKHIRTVLEFFWVLQFFTVMHKIAKAKKRGEAFGPSPLLI